MPIATAAMLAGLLFGASLIVSFGAQNTFVLRQGLRGAHTTTVVAICTVSDLLLIAAGIAGGGVALGGRHGALGPVRLLGAAFLVAFAVLAVRRVLRPPARGQGPRDARSLAAVAGTCLAFTWLNPAVYLDTVVLLGSVANSHAGQRWWFGVGAALASLGWFALLGFGARLLAPCFARAWSWRLLDGLVAVVMLGTAARLLAGGA